MSTARPFRYEWDGTVRRLKLPPLVKLVAAYSSQYADNAGRHIRPGVERLALETQTSPATVKRCLKRLRDLGLLELVRSGSSSCDPSGWSGGLPTDSPSGGPPDPPGLPRAASRRRFAASLC